MKAIAVMTALCVVACGYTEQEMQVKRDRIDNLERALDQLESDYRVSLNKWKACAMVDAERPVRTSTAAVQPPRGGSRFSGNGTSTTRPFTVDGPWEARWSVVGSDGLIFQLSAETTDGAASGIIGSQTGDGEGRTYVRRGGTFMLGVIANGNWTIDVVPQQEGP
jgi:hypothetical protein